MHLALLVLVWALAISFAVPVICGVLFLLAFLFILFIGLIGAIIGS